MHVSNSYCNYELTIAIRTDDDESCMDAEQASPTTAIMNQPLLSIPSPTPTYLVNVRDPLHYFAQGISETKSRHYFVQLA